ncbi:hypothetical protein Tco_0681133 [Tanacetum coccineum]|uniref:Reverse transcriptase domain-containing protein n=1 Tax=Tanacetum coccineum TaxID=301880 RepID=A0ABQ4XMS8_9ASTR
MNEDYYHEQNSCYDHNSFGFDQIQPPQYTVNHPIFNSQNDLLDSQNKLMKQMATLRELVDQAIQKKEEEKRIAEEQAARDRSWKIPICYDDDEDNTIAITPVLPIEEPVNSLSMGDEHLDTIPETESDEFIKSSVEDLVPIPSEPEGIPDSMCDVPLCNNPTSLEAFKEHSETIIDSNDDSTSSDDDSYENIDYVDASPPDDEIVGLEVVEIVDPEVGRIDDDILLTIKDDILREKLLNVNLLIAKIDALRDNPTPSSEVVIKSTSTFPNLFLEETNTFDNSFPESETFRFNLEEISSGSPTTHSELSLPDYKAFYIDNDHFKEKSSGSTTTHVDFSQYDSFIFDLSNDQFPPADRSDFYHEEFADGLAHIISPNRDFPDCEDSRACSIYMSFTSSASFWESRTDNQEKDEKQSQNDKTGLGMEKTVKDKAKSKPESSNQVQKVNRKVQLVKDLLEKAFIKKYCSPFKTTKKLEIIRNFKEEMDETLYYAWERYNDLLFKCLHHDMNCQQKVHIFYTGLDIPTRRVLDSKGFIPLMTQTQALISIQVMVEHSHNWYYEATTRERINDSPNKIDTKKPKENIHASFKNCEGAHLTMEYPLEKEDKAVEQSKYMRSLKETIIKFCENSIMKQAADN